MLRTLLSIPVLAAAVAAYGAEPPASPSRQTATAAKAIDTELQAHIAGGLILGNQEEIALCQFALTRAQNPKVKELIQKMIDDHTKFLAELKKFAPQSATREFRQRVEGGIDSRASASRNRHSVQTVSQKTVAESTPEAVSSSNPPASPRGQSFSERVFAVEYESANECLALNRKLLEKYQGASFDQAFLGQQIGMHVGMLARLKAGTKFTTGEFQLLLKKGQETAKHHKQHAEQLMEELAKGAIEKSGTGQRS